MDEWHVPIAAIASTSRAARIRVVPFAPGLRPNAKPPWIAPFGSSLLRSDLRLLYFPNHAP